MPIDRNISFRAHLIGSMDEFVASSAMEPVVRARFLIELIVKLGQYREEGRDLTPEVYIFEDVAAALQLLPGHSLLRIGTTTISENSVAEILKKSAPLAIDGWCIYIGKAGDGLVYGVFRDELNPLALSVSDALVSGGDESAKVVRLHQNAQNCVELTNYRGDKHMIFLSHKPESAPNPAASIDSLAATICEQVASRRRESTQTFIRRTLTTALEAAHGALIAVCKSQSVPAFLRDGSVLDEPLNFAEMVRTAQGGAQADQLALICKSALIRGMLSCDGIVVFDRRARLLAYNCFIRPTDPLLNQRSGGARQRAFDALCSKLGRGTHSAFIRSQDGGSQFRKA